MLGIDAQELQARIVADGEFRRASRLWDGSIVLSDGVGELRVHLGSDGPVVSEASTAPTTISISGAPGAWDALLERVPRAHFQDVVGATSTEGAFTFGGDLQTLWAYYPAVARLVAVMRELRAKAKVMHA